MPIFRVWLRIEIQLMCVKNADFVRVWLRLEVQLMCVEHASFCTCILTYRNTIDVRGTCKFLYMCMYEQNILHFWFWIIIVGVFMKMYRCMYMHVSRVSQRELS
jgi:hypothetical protein